MYKIRVLFGDESSDEPKEKLTVLFEPESFPKMEALFIEFLAKVEERVGVYEPDEHIRGESE